MEENGEIKMEDLMREIQMIKRQNEELKEMMKDNKTKKYKNEGKSLSGTNLREWKTMKLSDESPKLVHTTPSFSDKRQLRIVTHIRPSNEDPGSPIEGNDIESLKKVIVKLNERVKSLEYTLKLKDGVNQKLGRKLQKTQILLRMKQFKNFHYNPYLDEYLINNTKVERLDKDILKSDYLKKDQIQVTSSMNLSDQPKFKPDILKRSISDVSLEYLSYISSSSTPRQSQVLSSSVEVEPIQSYTESRSLPTGSPPQLKKKKHSSQWKKTSFPSPKNNVDFILRFLKNEENMKRHPYDRVDGKHYEIFYESDVVNCLKRCFNMKQKNITNLFDEMLAKNLILVVKKSKFAQKRKYIFAENNKISISRNRSQDLVMASKVLREKAPWIFKFSLKFLENETCVKYFRLQLSAEYSEENIDFLVDTKGYEDEDVNKRKEIANKVYEKYFRDPNINLAHTITQYIKENYLFVPIDLFTKAKDEIRYIMLSDSFPRFTKSPLFNKMLTEYYSQNFSTSN